MPLPASKYAFVVMRVFMAGLMRMISPVGRTSVVGEDGVVIVESG